MRLVTSNDPIFDNLIDEKSRIVYHLLFQIKKDPKAFIVTNDTSYIFAQDSKRTPNWVFINQKPDDLTTSELTALISGMIKLNPLLRVNGNSEFLRPILEAVSTRSGVTLKVDVPMSVYYCKKLSKAPSKGQMISPKEMHRERLKELISSMSRDNDGLLLDADDSEKYISSMVHSNSIFLWEDEKIVSIAKIASKTDNYARINTIFTALEERDKGYTKMLIGELSDKLISEGLTPIIYADSRIEAKIDAFKQLGYEKAGEITQYSFVQKL